MPEKVFNALLGAIWVVSGYLMAWFPTPPHGPRDRIAALPYIGVVIMGAGIWFIAKAIRVARTDAGRPKPAARLHNRHSAATDLGDVAKIVGLCLAVIGLASWGLWWGIHRGLLSVVGLASSMLGPALLMVASRIWVAVATRARSVWEER